MTDGTPITSPGLQVPLTPERFASGPDSRFPSSGPAATVPATHRGSDPASPGLQTRLEQSAGETARFTEPIMAWSRAQTHFSATDDDSPEKSSQLTAGVGDSPGQSPISKLEDELRQIEKRLGELLVGLQQQGEDNIPYERAIRVALSGLGDRHLNDSESHPAEHSRRQSTISAGLMGSGGGRQPETLLGLCNPMLDMSLRVDPSFLEKYGLDPDGWAAATEKTIEIFGYLDDHSATQFIPGGSGMNTLRVAQWILDSPGATTFVGATGDDDFSMRLRQATEAEGVNFPRIQIEEEPTGTCAVLLTGESRSLVANLGAGAIFKPEWLKERQELAQIARHAGLYYATGFFLRTSPETVKELGRVATSRQKELALNMSAAFVCEIAADLFRDVLPVVDVLFGNSVEAIALAKALGLITPEEAGALSVPEVARRLQAFEKKGRPRTVVITRGPDNVVVYAEDGYASYDTQRVPAEAVVDTNGAGDAFAGGFLARRLQGGSVEDCVRTGQWAAAVIIAQPGCTVPNCHPSAVGMPCSPNANRRVSVVESRRLSLCTTLSPLGVTVGTTNHTDRRASRTALGWTDRSMMDYRMRTYSMRHQSFRKTSEGPTGSNLGRSGSLNTGTLLGLCNPLLDLTLRTDEAFLKKYGLAANGWAAATEETLGIFEVMAANPETSYTPGGSGMNTLRVAQWILEAHGATTFMGTTGADDFGKRLHACTEAEGLCFPVIEHSTLPTGTCAVLLTGDDRSLVANLGASAVFDVSWLKERPDLTQIVENAGVYYVTGFFLRTSPETVAHFAQLAQSKEKELCLNLSAAFVCEGSVGLFREALPTVDVLFGNSEEAFALAKALGTDPGTECAAVAKRLQALARAGSPQHPSRGRTVVITQGPGPVIVATDDGCVEYGTLQLPPEQVVDTNGAGDAFAGGFLARRMQGGSIPECVRMGQWAASIIIGQPGCTLPPKPADQMPGYGSATAAQPAAARQVTVRQLSAQVSDEAERPPTEKRVQISEPQKDNDRSDRRESPLSMFAGGSGSNLGDKRRPSMSAQAQKFSHQHTPRTRARTMASFGGGARSRSVLSDMTFSAGALAAAEWGHVSFGGSAGSVAVSTPSEQRGLAQTCK
eukprot:TRINITY_DN9629_c0_g4_i1.p1 TRINITY_DN9629_c0_g4~~TRINITY_DN9629_c0_g4_i1.p1  ORF type:complete len:1140 (+),score=355.15 TRINITY_DN9629_c0_g4_i1:78-3422(+)